MFNFKKEEKMKKFFMTLAAVCVAATMDAQVYIGGGIGLQSSSYDGNTTTVIKLMPEVGYNLNESWALGIALGYGEVKDDNTKHKTFAVNPYARYNFAKFDKVNLFVDGGLTYAHTDNAGAKANSFSLGLKPGIAVNLNDKLSFVAHAGFLGWTTSKPDVDGAKSTNTFGFDLDGSDLSFGFYYNF
jgi:hypothetical protein